MQTRCLPDLSNTATFDRDRLIWCDGDSGVRNPEKPSLHPLTRLIPNRKRIALVAHDNQKEQLASWTLKHRTRLIEHELVHLVRTMKEFSVLDGVLIWPDAEISGLYRFGPQGKHLGGLSVPRGPPTWRITARRRQVLEHRGESRNTAALVRLLKAFARSSLTAVAKPRTQKTSASITAIQPSNRPGRKLRIARTSAGSSFN